MGSKARIAKHILPIMLENRLPGQYYVEPFVGGCNSIDKVSGRRLAGDANVYLIEMWKGLQYGKERPYIITKEMYNRHREAFNEGDKTNLFLTGWVGWMASFNGRFFDGGYSGKLAGRDYVQEQIRNTEKQIESILGVVFFACDYAVLPVPNNSIIYCDIPYRGTKKYLASKSFDYSRFWAWCREKSSEGHSVFVSEYSAPMDFRCVWEMEVTNSMNTTKTIKTIEKLFVHESQV